MKKNATSKRRTLTLSRNTLRVLEDTRLAAAAGGTLAVQYTTRQPTSYDCRR